MTVGAVEYEFDIVDGDGDTPQHEYRGDDEPPVTVTDALDAWVAEHHDVDGGSA